MQHDHRYGDAMMMCMTVASACPAAAGSDSLTPRATELHFVVLLFPFPLCSLYLDWYIRLNDVQFVCVSLIVVRVWKD